MIYEKLVDGLEENKMIYNEKKSFKGKVYLENIKIGE